MKNITKTITSRRVSVRVYDEVNDTLNNDIIIVTGEKFDGSIERKYRKNFQALKITDVSEPTTATYTMNVNTFMENATQSDFYQYGFINRKIGGKVAVCKVYNLENDTIEEIEVAHDTEKKIEKALIEDNYKLIKVMEVKTVDEKFYTMSEVQFMAYATVK